MKYSIHQKSGYHGLSNIYIRLCLIFTLLIIVTATPGFSQSDGPSFNFPVQFTRNDGQWAEEVRYAVLHKGDGFELLRDGIRMRPRNDPSRQLPDLETPRRQSDALELRFISPSPKMRIIEEDPSVTLTHFYTPGMHGPRWENVPNFRKIIYENVWQHVNVEYATDGVSSRQRIVLFPGADASSVRIACGTEMMHVMKQSSVSEGLQRSTESGGIWDAHDGALSIAAEAGSLRDTAALETEFQTFFGGSGYEELWSHVVDRNGVIYATGASDVEPGANTFPLKGAIGDTSKATWRTYACGIGCDGQTLLFSTFLSLCVTLGPEQSCVGGISGWGGGGR